MLLKIIRVMETLFTGYFMIPSKEVIIGLEKQMSTDLQRYLQILLINVLHKEFPLLEIMEVC